MQNNSNSNSNLKVSDIDPNPKDAEDKKESTYNFVEVLPPELTCKIFSLLDIQSFCRASQTCHRWNDIIRNTDFLWKPHCLIWVAQEDRDKKRQNGYSWRDILLTNEESKVKIGWLIGRYSNYTPDSQLENIMCPVDADTWGKFFEAECQRQ
ncbi:F-box only protein 48 [Sorex fumeus]|uniref:F-box only protein 48 n=1 Tax=Sorex fumeus TaxID=62283 RepID=UPI0024AD6162|nr:F-box only protein 48 [Sorex fumeus]